MLEEVEDGWSRGRQLRTNLIGMFPTNFVKLDGLCLSILFPTRQYMCHILARLLAVQEVALPTFLYLVPSCNSVTRDEEKVVVRRPADPDQPEANRRTPSAIGVSVFGTKQTHFDVKDDTRTKGDFDCLLSGGND